MKWGIGIGRSGTMSLAKQLGGEHEPIIGHKSPLNKFYTGYRLYDAHTPVDDLVFSYGLKVLMEDVSCSADWRYVAILDLIENVDPAAEFIYVWRDPLPNIESFLAGHWETREKDLRNLLEDQFPDYWPWTLQTCVARYIVLNNRICEHLENTERKYTVLNVKELEVHALNAFGGAKEVTWTDEVQDAVIDACKPVVERIQNLGGENATHGN